MEVVLLPQASVPILKLKDKKLNVNADISEYTYNDKIVKYINYLIHFNNDIRICSLIIAIKYWNRSRNINDSYHGFINSFRYTILCLKYLQILGDPIILVVGYEDCNLFSKQQSLVIESDEYLTGCQGVFSQYYSCSAEYHSMKILCDKSFDRKVVCKHYLIESLTYGFFEFYCHYYWDQYQISLNCRESKPKNYYQFDQHYKADNLTFVIEDPLKPNKNCAKNVKPAGARLLINEFKRARYILANGRKWDDVCSFVSIDKQCKNYHILNGQFVKYKAQSISHVRKRNRSCISIGDVVQGNKQQRLNNSVKNVKFNNVLDNNRNNKCLLGNGNLKIQNRIQKGVKLSKNNSMYELLKTRKIDKLREIYGYNYKRHQCISVLYIQSKFLEDIFNGSKTAEISSVVISKFKQSRPIGLRDGSGYILGEMMVSSCEYILKSEVKNMVDEHQIRDEDDIYQFIDSARVHDDKIYVWRLCNVKKYPQKIYYPKRRYRKWASPWISSLSLDPIACNAAITSLISSKESISSSIVSRSSNDLILPKISLTLSECERLLSLRRTNTCRIVKSAVKTWKDCIENGKRVSSSMVQEMIEFLSNSYFSCKHQKIFNKIVFKFIYLYTMLLLVFCGFGLIPIDDFTNKDISKSTEINLKQSVERLYKMNLSFNDDYHQTAWDSLVECLEIQIKNQEEIVNCIGGEILTNDDYWDQFRNYLSKANPLVKFCTILSNCKNPIVETGLRYKGAISQLSLLKFDDLVPTCAVEYLRHNKYDRFHASIDVSRG